MNPEKKEPKDLTNGIFCVVRNFCLYLKSNRIPFRVYVHMCVCMHICERERQKERDQLTQRETKQKERKSWLELCFEKITLGIVWSMDGEDQGGMTRPQSPVIPLTPPLHRVAVFPHFLFGRTTDSNALESLVAHLL